MKTANQKWLNMSEKITAFNTKTSPINKHTCNVSKINEKYLGRTHFNSEFAWLYL